MKEKIEVNYILSVNNTMKRKTLHLVFEYIHIWHIFIISTLQRISTPNTTTTMNDDYTTTTVVTSIQHKDTASYYYNFSFFGVFLFYFFFCYFFFFSSSQIRTIWLYMDVSVFEISKCTFKDNHKFHLFLLYFFILKKNWNERWNENARNNERIKTGNEKRKNFLWCHKIICVYWNINVCQAICQVIASL